MSNYVFRKTTTGLLLLFITLTVCAQQKDGERKMTVSNSQTYRISYVDERRLFQKGDVVTLAALDLEWPERISGSLVEDLQNWLCSTLFGNDCHSLSEGMKQFYGTLGTEIFSMPEDPNIKRQNVTLKLIEMGWDKDRYMSFRVMAQHRDGDEPTPKVNINRLITYDVVADQILTTNELIKGKYMPNKYYHTEMVAMIASVMPKMDKTLDADDMPDQVCLLDKRLGAAFSLKNIPDDDGMDMLIEIKRSNMLDYFLSSKAIKLLNREETNKKKTRQPAPALEQEYMEDGQPVYLVVDSMPEYPEGMKQLSEYIMQHLSYPEFEKQYKIQGRVVVSFVVRADGRICRPAVILPLSPGIDRAAVKAVLDLKSWTPGKLNGVPVNVRMAIPLVFKM